MWVSIIFPPQNSKKKLKLKERKCSKAAGRRKAPGRMGEQEDKEASGRPLPVAGLNSAPSLSTHLDRCREIRAKVHIAPEKLPAARL